MERLDQRDKLCALLKVAIECKMITHEGKGETLFGHHPFNRYLEECLFERYPILRQRAQGKQRNIWEYFLAKYAYMIKDELYNALRNATRQKRFMKRVF